MMALLILLCLLTLANLIASSLLLFQRTEDRRELDQLVLLVHAVVGALQRQKEADDEVAQSIGQTWLSTAQDQARVEQILTRQGRTRAHARTGSDPFLSNVKLAP